MIGPLVKIIIRPSLSRKMPNETLGKRQAMSFINKCDSRENDRQKFSFYTINKLLQYNGLM